MSVNYNISDAYCSTVDIIESFNRRKYDVIQNTPGGAINFGKKTTSLQMGRASILLVEAIKEKRFLLEVELIDRRKTLVLKESAAGNIAPYKCSKKSDLDWRFVFCKNADKALVSEYMSKSALHPRSPKVLLKVVDPVQTGGDIWIAIVQAERTRI